MIRRFCIALFSLTILGVFTLIGATHPALAPISDD